MEDRRKEWRGCKSKKCRQWYFVGLCQMFLKVTDVVFDKCVLEPELNQFHGVEDDDKTVT